jgi:hypothetical protein
MVHVNLADGTCWKGIPGDGWVNVETGEKITDAEMEKRLK